MTVWFKSIDYYKIVTGIFTSLLVSAFKKMYKSKLIKGQRKSISLYFKEKSSGYKQHLINTGIWIRVRYIANQVIDSNVLASIMITSFILAILFGSFTAFYTYESNINLGKSSSEAFLKAFTYFLGIFTFVILSYDNFKTIRKAPVTKI